MSGDPTIVFSGNGPPIIRNMPQLNIPLTVDLGGHLFQGNLRMADSGEPYLVFKEYETSRGAGGPLKITLLDVRGRKMEFDQNDPGNRP